MVRAKDIDAVRKAAALLQHLGSGELAELRRTSEAPAFCRLAARHPDTIGRQDREMEWGAIIRILALLTPKGDRAGRPRLDNRDRPLGAVLCDGGDPNWPAGGTPQAVFSEHRLQHLLASRGTQRTRALERAARMLSARMKPGSGIDVTDIAAALLAPEDKRRIAAAYYNQLDRAQWAAQSSETTKE